MESTHLVTILAYLLSFTYLETRMLSEQHCMSFVPRCSYLLYQDVLLSECYMFSRCTNECNSIYALPFGVDFHKSDQYQRYYVQISLCRSTVNVESTDRNSVLDVYDDGDDDITNIDFIVKSEWPYGLRKTVLEYWRVN